MSWEIESEEIDLSEMEHRTTFIERTVATRDAKPARYLLQIRLGQPMALRLNATGEVVDADGKEYDLRAKQQEILANLNALHQGARAIARRHNIPLTKGQKK